jgi:hypothetical protein
VTYQGRRASASRKRSLQDSHLFFTSGSWNNILSQRHGFKAGLRTAGPRPSFPWSASFSGNPLNRNLLSRDNLTVHLCSLGDRHGENILFDSSTGDTVHVDFNCLFDKASI